MVFFVLIGAVVGLKTPCESCRLVGKGLKKEMEKSAKSNFGGGNTRWEEKSLGPWATSETRFEHCIEYACNGHGKDDSFTCNNFVEKYEETIEEWFKSSPEEKNIDFYQRVCVEEATVCCPEMDQFGPECAACPKGLNGEVCSGRGKCEGAGDRKGKGGCKCDYNYKGELCDQCKNNDFYLATAASETEKPECTRCNFACQNGCTGGTASDCNECASQYFKSFSEDEEKFECVRCNTGCQRECTGPGAHECKDNQCASGYELVPDEDGREACTKKPKPTSPPEPEEPEEDEEDQSEEVSDDPIETLSKEEL